jgi:hypothetical protein
MENTQHINSGFKKPTDENICKLVQFLNPRAWTQYIIHSTQKTRLVSRVFRDAIEVRVMWRLSPTDLSHSGLHNFLAAKCYGFKFQPFMMWTTSWVRWSFASEACEFRHKLVEMCETGTTTTKCKSLEVYQLLVTSSIYALWDPMQWYNFRQVRRQALHEPDNDSLMSKCIWLWRNHGLADQVNIYAS